MCWSRISALLIGMCFSACAEAPVASDSPQTDSALEVSESRDVGISSPRDAESAGEGEVVDATRRESEVAMDVSPSDLGPIDEVSEGTEPLDALDTGEVEVEAPPLLASCDISVSDNDGVYATIAATYEGYGDNAFGAAVYGTMLKVWVSEGESAVELLIRMDQTTIPGEIVPGVPGNEAWVVMIIDDSEVYSTQPPSGVITLENCPSEEGTLLSGTISGVVLFDMGDMTPVTVDGVFEVVVGDVSGEAICSGL